MKINKMTGVVGLGNMGGAIIGGMLKAGIVNKKYICAFDTDGTKKGRFKRQGIKICGNSSILARDSAIIVLAVKPQEIKGLLREIRDEMTGDKLVVSIAAGVNTRYIEKILGKTAVIRVMPNIAIGVGEGASAICRGRYAMGRDERVAVAIFGSMGRTFKVEEKLINAVTAVSGSGPAYFFEIINHMVMAAAKAGMPPDISRNLVVQTVRGAVEMLEKTKKDPVVLRDMVTSKKGTTIEALNLMKKMGLKNIIFKAVFAAKKRANELTFS